ncbi:methyltransferase domain-containing protein [Halobacteriovorax marinus]|uniref:methyltransferase domain-containing protein n=1 Tax=Halobacteriovorax marinus TaxID=97084 RepID=UPI000BDEED34|nr:methyltransferase domain-containing protein [Halobacteriovorax marinus]
MKLEEWMHIKVANSSHSETILEVGAGTINHPIYEKNFSQYDIVEPQEYLYRNSNQLKFINNRYLNLSQIEADKKYDKICSIAVLEHLENLPFDLYQALQHLKPGGRFAAGIPSEGGLLWGLTWRLTTGVAFFLKHRLNYKNLMRYEHVNDDLEIIDILSFLFKDVTIKRFPLPYRHFSWYTFLDCKEVNYVNLNKLKEVYDERD